MDSTDSQRTDLSVVAGEETLAAYRLLAPSGEELLPVVFLHGAGKSCKERTYPIARSLADRGARSYGLDFSGHGESTGTLAASSLDKRASEARAAIDYLDVPTPFALFASSMGAHTALALLPHYDVGALVLLCPAVYSRESESLRFDSGFSQAIRKPEAWRQNGVVENLRRFSGRLLVVMGAEDHVIPPGVVELIAAAVGGSASAKHEFLTLSGVGHLILQDLAEEPERFEELVEKVAGVLEG